MCESREISRKLVHLRYNSRIHTACVIHDFNCISVILKIKYLLNLKILQNNFECCHFPVNETKAII